MALFCQSKLFNIKLTWVVRGTMDVLYVYCFKSVGSYKHKLSRIESVVILYWGINCTYNNSQVCVFDAMRGDGYVLSFWRVVQNMMAMLCATSCSALI